MKKCILATTLCLFSIFLFCGCGNTKSSNEQDDKHQQSKTFILKEYLDKFMKQNGESCFNNSISETECSKVLGADFLLTQLGDSIKCISELPVKFEMALEYNQDKYVAKFTYGKYTSKHTLSSDYDVSFQIFTILSKDEILQLKEGSLYHLFGSCKAYANKESFTLPSGKYIESPPKVYKIGDEKNIYLGTLIVTDVTFQDI